MIYDIIVIGSGPAGFTASIYASRAHLSVLQFEGEQPGGQLTTTTVIENFPGFKDGIDGNQLMAEMREQAKRFGVETKFDMVTKVDATVRPFKVFVGETQYEAKTIIVATGARARYLGLDNEKRLIGRGVSTCATCDGFFFKGKELVVVGGGDSAMEEANHLTKFATKVTLLNRTETFRASPIMLKRVQDNPKITIMNNSVITDVLGEDKVTGVRIKNTQTNEEIDFSTDGLFLAIGHIPNTEMFKGIIDMDELNYMLTQPDSMKTNVEGIYAAGDVQDRTFRQAITAAGTGCMAALEAQRYLEELHHKEVN